MKLIYLAVDGRATIENTKLRTRQMEMPDGYHPVTNDSVWQDAKRLRDSIMVIIQGVRGPYGATMEVEDVSSVLYEIDVIERAFKNQSVSRIWQRAFARFGEWLLKYGILLGFAVLALSMVANQLLMGGM